MDLQFLFLFGFIWATLWVTTRFVKIIYAAFACTYRVLVHRPDNLRNNNNKPKSQPVSPLAIPRSSTPYSASLAPLDFVLGPQLPPIPDRWVSKYRTALCNIEFLLKLEEASHFSFFCSLFSVDPQDTWVIAQTVWQQDDEDTRSRRRWWMAFATEIGHPRIGSLVSGDWTYTEATQYYRETLLDGLLTPSQDSFHTALQELAHLRLRIILDEANPGGFRAYTVHGTPL